MASVRQSKDSIRGQRGRQKMQRHAYQWFMGRWQAGKDAQRVGQSAVDGRTAEDRATHEERRSMEPGGRPADSGSMAGLEAELPRTDFS